MPTNQFGFSYMRVTANDGTGSTTTAFQVVVREVNDLSDDAATTKRSASVSINVHSKRWHAGYHETGGSSKRQSCPKRHWKHSGFRYDDGAQSTPNFRCAPGSNREITTSDRLQPSDDVSGGLLYTDVRQNGRDNGKQPVGWNAFLTDAIDSGFSGYWIALFEAPVVLSTTSWPALLPVLKVGSPDGP